MKRKLTIGTVADPIRKFDPVAETTSFILYEAGQRGHELWMMEIGDIFVEGAKVFSSAKKVQISKRNNKFTYKIVSKKTLPLESFDIVFLRKDPPVDMAYINHLTMLELLETPIFVNSPSPPLNPSTSLRTGLRGGRGALYLDAGMTPLFINSPSGIKMANEKIFPLRFPGLSPPTVVSSSRDILEDFLHRNKKCVLKPLNSGGGQGVVLVHSGSRRDSCFRRNDISGVWGFEMSSNLFRSATKNFTEQVLLQKYLPEAKKGDKRVLLLDGKILGYFLRIPKKGEFRANLHQGGRFVKTTLSEREKKLIEKMVPSLKQAGLHFVGVDIIGNFITEVNVTSPMGIREINQIDNSQIEKKWLDGAENAVF